MERGAVDRTRRWRPPSSLSRMPLPRAYTDLAAGFRITWLSWSILPPVAYGALVAGVVARGRAARWPVAVVLGGGTLAAAPWWSQVRRARREYAHYRVQADAAREVEDIVGQQGDAGSAARTIEDRAVTGAPFVLLLRGFQGEASGRPARIDYTPSRQVRRELRALRLANPGARVEPGFLHQGNVSEVERGLAAALDGRLPVVAVANPDDELGRHLVARLPLAAEEWEEGVAVLISGASLIVVDCPELSPGVVRELELLQEGAAQDRTVVVVSPPPEPLDRIFDVLGPVVTQRHPVADPAALPLSSFPRVIRSTDVDFGDLWADPRFADLLVAAEHQAGTALVNAAVADHDGRRPRTAEVLPRLERGAAALLRAGDPVGAALARTNLGIAQADLGDPGTGLETLQSASGDLARLGDAVGLGVVRANIARVLHSTGRVDEAFAEAEGSLEVFGDSSDPSVGLALRIAGQAALARADLVTAAARFSRLLDFAVEHDLPDSALRARTHLGILAAVDDWPTADEHFRAAVEQATAMGDAAHLQQVLAIVHDATERHAHALAQEGIAALNAGDPATAVETLDQALRDLGGTEAAETRQETTFRLAMALHGAGRPSEAIDRFAESAALAHVRGDRRRQGLALSNLGALEGSEGRTGDALGHLTEALEIQRADGSPQEVEWTLLALVPLLVAAGRDAEARDGADELRGLMGERWPGTQNHPD
jgi:tetratricopeptide (TPR) repeat protein